jgi:hypothetical protein
MPPLFKHRVGHPGEQAQASRVGALAAVRFETRAQGGTTKRAEKQSLMGRA